MSRILIAYSTVDGHTLKISKRLKQAFEQSGHTASLAAIDDEPNCDPAAFEQIVVGASIRYGKYRPALFRFIEANRDALENRPSAFFSVNLVARKKNKATPETNPYVRKTFSRGTTWVPDEMAVFAGKVDYVRYGFVDRQVIRFIMLLTRGPTDPTACVEYTDWRAVDSFAHRLGAGNDS